MITNFVHRGHPSLIRVWSASWAPDLREQIQGYTYEDLLRLQKIPAGACIFSDIEFVSAEERAIATALADHLERVGRGHVRVLNHPKRVLMRYDLLRQQHACGLNTFRVFRATESRAGLRFPVFIRHEHYHWGNLSDLLSDHESLNAALAEQAARGLVARQLLVVEYCHTGDVAGLFRKYSAFSLGGQIIPRHLIFSRHWSLKVPDLLDAGKLDEERCYLDQNPHRDWISRTFALAGVDYGRIDYGILDGQPATLGNQHQPLGHAF